MRARQAVAEDFFEFDYVLAMDKSNLHNLQKILPDDGLVSGLVDGLVGELKAEAKTQPQLFLQAFSTPNLKSQGLTEVPDPYYGEKDGFEEVLDMVEEACDQLILDIKSKL